MGMAKKGLISPGRTAEGRPGFALKPFVYGFYEEYQGPMTEDLAQRFDAYFHASFARLLTFQPQIHRVLPVGEVVHKELAVRPYETVDALLERMQSFAVVPCICRTQRKMAGDPCGHPIDVCMVVNPQANVFTSGGHLRALTREEARDTLRFAADSGLVHSVSNTRQDGFYICNCCTCGCGLLRGVAELGIAGVMASSAFISVVAEALCGGCETCVSACQFEAIRVDGIARVNGLRCAGCGLCVRVCPNEALSLSRREQEVIPPLDEREWGEARQRSR
jgi:Na+-translocating ferredoxin:NAD+ oxidoreductase RNF subunit RnfB